MALKSQLLKCHFCSILGDFLKARKFFVREENLIQRNGKHGAHFVMCPGNIVIINDVKTSSGNRVISMGAYMESPWCIDIDEFNRPELLHRRRGKPFHAGNHTANLSVP